MDLEYPKDLQNLSHLSSILEPDLLMAEDGLMSFTPTISQKVTKNIFHNLINLMHRLKILLSHWYSLTVSSIFTAGVWSCPATTGERPPPCVGLTFTAVDDRRAVVFGGNDGEQGDMNDVYIIDLSTMVHAIVSICSCVTRQ